MATSGTASRSGKPASASGNASGEPSRAEPTRQKSTSAPRQGNGERDASRARSQERRRYAQNARGSKAHQQQQRSKDHDRETHRHNHNRRKIEFPAKESYSVIADEVVPNRTVSLPAAWSDEWAQAHFFFGAKTSLPKARKKQRIAPVKLTLFGMKVLLEHGS